MRFIAPGPCFSRTEGQCKPPFFCDTPHPICVIVLLRPHLQMPHKRIMAKSSKVLTTKVDLSTGSQRWFAHMGEPRSAWVTSRKWVTSSRWSFLSSLRQAVAMQLTPMLVWNWCSPGNGGHRYGMTDSRHHWRPASRRNKVVQSILTS